MKPTPTPVLVVGDDEPLRTAIADSLDQEGFLVETSSSSDAMDLRLVEGNRPRLIVLDAAMPAHARSKFLSHTANSKPPIVALSSLAELRAIAAHDGVWVCLAKPVEMDVLVHAVSRITSYSSALAS